MKLNKKGVSIIELIISVALVAVIMLFMYRLLSDITYEKDNDSFASLNQEKRVTIIKEVEKVIREDGSIDNITCTTSYINFRKGNATIYTLYRESTNKLQFKKGSTILDYWTINGGTLSTPTCPYVDLSIGKLYECTYKIYTENTSNKEGIINFKGTDIQVNNNNIIDDLTFTFVL